MVVAVYAVPTTETIFSETVFVKGINYNTQAFIALLHDFGTHSSKKFFASANFVKACLEKDHRPMSNDAPPTSIPTSSQFGSVAPTQVLSSDPSMGSSLGPNRI